MPAVKPVARTAWTFLSNHAHVLVAITREPEARVRDLAQLVGITERAVLAILADLEASGTIVRRRVGRRTQYDIDRSIALRHPLEHHRTVGDIIGLVETPAEID
jgi:DNA-binding MarR family transcriptional regulator